jgi:K+-transporting ATPase A subunit
MSAGGAHSEGEQSGGVMKGKEVAFAWTHMLVWGHSVTGTQCQLEGGCDSKDT